MKVCIIGDPHGNLARIKKIPLKGVELIILTGDLGSSQFMRKMAFENVERRKKGMAEKNYTDAQQKKAFMEAYSSTITLINYLRTFAPVQTIFGNVECTNRQTQAFAREINQPLPLLANDLNALENVRVINNRVAKVGETRIGGLAYFTDTNWVQDFKPANYNKSLTHAKRATAKAKKALAWFDKVDVLVCHQPPYGILDKVTSKFAPKAWQGKHAGSKTILSYIKRKQPRFVFCGHIHEAQGIKKIGKTTIYNLGEGDHVTLHM